MPLSSAHKAAVVEFIGITGATEKVAQRFLKNSSYRMDEAVDSFYSSGASGGFAPSVSRESALTKQFESLRDAQDDKDKIGPDNTIKYLQNVGVDLEDASSFILLEIVKAETIGEIKKDGVDGNIAAQKKHVTNLVARLSKDKDLFKKVARYAFVAGKEPDQRALALDNAVLYWTMLFAPPGRPWVGKQTGIDFFPLWTQYLTEKWTRTVSRDMWNQTLLFAEKSTEDESLSFWSPEASWPNVIDDFVAWFKARPQGGGAMEVDQSA
ncbi:Cullin binding-domain-containing protein [Apiospora kogelbergensis]|uniref:Defective in cullin neddylation protein n=1 Tax=Apiospora kogelbergensis TaxID=1337665 RepID=A0AAW0QNV3_9PEZI